MNNRGSILVFTIWVLVFFVFLNTALYRMVSAQIAVVKRFRKQVVSPYLAKTAYQYVRAQRESDQTEYDTLFELGGQQEKELGDGKIIYTIIDEESNININTASQDILMRLPGMEEETAKDIAGSELKPFSSLEELFLIEEIDEETYDEFKDLVTVYGSGRVNINTASEEVLAVLGFDEDLIRAVKLYRAGADGEEGSEDDGIFEDQNRIVSDLRSVQGLFNAQETLILNLAGKKLLGTSATVFSLYVDTEIRNSPGASYRIVMDKEKIRQWTER